MGTSKSYASPNTARWNAVKTSYKNSSIPTERIASEVWRAATSENNNLENMLSADIIYRCNQIVENNSNAIDAFKAFSQEIINSKQSSLITEFAKRAIVKSFNVENAVQTWRGNFISEITDYFVSRDASGYFGSEYRNKSIGDISVMRNEIKNTISDRIKNVSQEISNHDDWKKFINSSLDSIKNKK